MIIVTLQQIRRNTVLLVVVQSGIELIQFRETISYEQSII